VSNNSDEECLLQTPEWLGLHDAWMMRCMPG